MAKQTSGADSGGTDAAIAAVYRASEELGELQANLATLDRQAIYDLLMVLRYTAKHAQHSMAKDDAKRLLRRLDVESSSYGAKS